MHWLATHIASGQSFFSGIGLLVVGVAATWCPPSRCERRVVAIGFLLGLAAVVLSSTAIPYWYYALAATATLAWLASRYFTAWRRGASLVFLVAWLGAAAIEIPYCLMPTMHPAESRAMTVIGDSVTAGMGGEDKARRWPEILAGEHGVEVQDLSRMGATAASALERVKESPITAPVVILEIGGNDLLGSTTAAKFAQDLDALLAAVVAPGRQVLLFELPLPPLHHEFGRIQRVLAKKHGVGLIPKRVFMSILAPKDSTLDTIHLSPTGHQRMAATVWAIVAPAFPDQNAGP